MIRMSLNAVFRAEGVLKLITSLLLVFTPFQPAFGQKEEIMMITEDSRSKGMDYNDYGYNYMDFDNFYEDDFTEMVYKEDPQQLEQASLKTDVTQSEKVVLIPIMEEEEEESYDEEIPQFDYYDYGSRGPPEYGGGGWFGGPGGPSPVQGNKPKPKPKPDKTPSASVEDGGGWSKPGVEGSKEKDKVKDKLSDIKDKWNKLVEKFKIKEKEKDKVAEKGSPPPKYYPGPSNPPGWGPPPNNNGPVSSPISPEWWGQPPVISRPGTILEIWFGPRFLDKRS